jgi:hypothetical protein
VSVDTVERARRAAQTRWADTPPERRTTVTRPGRVAAAVKLIVDQAPTLTNDQRAKLRLILVGGDAV